MNYVNEAVRPVIIDEEPRKPKEVQNLKSRCDEIDVIIDKITDSTKTLYIKLYGNGETIAANDHKEPGCLSDVVDDYRARLIYISNTLVKINEKMG